jgi:protein phosphatase
MVSRLRPEIDFAGRAMQGQREEQEDYLAFEQFGGRLLLVLADGAGGQAAGEHASRNAVLGFLECFARSQDDTVPTLFAALHEGNRRVAAFMDGHAAPLEAMATTLLAVAIEERTLHWISVGDSPLLLFREGRLMRLNADHSMAGQDGASEGERDVLRSALDGKSIAMIDWRRQVYELQAGDILLAASDGLWTLSLAEIAAHLAVLGPDTAAVIANELLRLVKAKAKVNQDNVTIGVMKVPAEPSP